jgi:hypothetical protein
MPPTRPDTQCIASIATLGNVRERTVSLGRDVLKNNAKRAFGTGRGREGWIEPPSQEEALWPKKKTHKQAIVPKPPAP